MKDYNGSLYGHLKEPIYSFQLRTCCFFDFEIALTKISVFSNFVFFSISVYLLHIISMNWSHVFSGYMEVFLADN